MITPIVVIDVASTELTEGEDALWVPYPLTAKQIAALATDSR